MTAMWSRRAFLSAAGGGAWALGVPAGAEPAEEVHEAMRAVWRGLYLGGGFSAGAEPFRSRLLELGAQADAWRATMAPAPGSLWPELGFTTDPELMMQSYYRLRTMAEAYVRPGTGRTGDAALLSALLTGLDHLHTRVYHAGQARYGNWYCWQIGAPQALLDLCVLLYTDLGPARLTAFRAAVDHFVPDSAVASYSGTSTGANRVDLCRVLALSGVLGADSAKIGLARDALAPVFPYVSTGDGLYRDGSFVQHTWVPYTGTYGAVLLGGLGMLFALLRGTPWQVTDPGAEIVLDAVERAWAPFLFNGLIMDSVSGRAISRGLTAETPGRSNRTTTRGDMRYWPGSWSWPRARARLGGPGGGHWSRDGHSGTGTAPFSTIARSACPPWPDWRRWWSMPRWRRSPSRSGTGCSPRWTGPRTGGRAGPPPSPWLPAGSPTTRRATARTCTAGTPGAGCSPGGAPPTATVSTPTRSGPRWIRTGCRASRSRGRSSRTVREATGGLPGRMRRGWAGRRTGSSPRWDNTCGVWAAL